MNALETYVKFAIGAYVNFGINPFNSDSNCWTYVSKFSQSGKLNGTFKTVGRGFFAI